MVHAQEEDETINFGGQEVKVQGHTTLKLHVEVGRGIILDPTRSHKYYSYFFSCTFTLYFSKVMTPALLQGTNNVTTDSIKANGKRINNEFIVTAFKTHTCIHITIYIATNSAITCTFQITCTHLHSTHTINSSTQELIY